MTQVKATPTTQASAAESKVKSREAKRAVHAGLINLVKEFVFYPKRNWKVLRTVGNTIGLKQFQSGEHIGKGPEWMLGDQIEGDAGAQVRKDIVVACFGLC